MGMSKTSQVVLVPPNPFLLGKLLLPSDKAIGVVLPS